MAGHRRRAADRLFGISLDGTREIHDRYRKGRQGQPTFDEVMRGVRLLQQHHIEFNALACVARDTASHPLDVYRFFRNEGITFIQFTPIVERRPDQLLQIQQLTLAGPSALATPEANTQVTPWTVDPEQHCDLLIAIYEDWVRHDVGEMFVMNFEWALTAWMDEPSAVCVFAPQCGRAVAVEHEGSVFACDHSVYQEYRLGNVLADGLGAMVDGSVAAGFGRHKEETLRRWCRECEVRQACWGGCSNCNGDFRVVVVRLHGTVDEGATIMSAKKSTRRDASIPHHPGETLVVHREATDETGEEIGHGSVARVTQRAATDETGETIGGGTVGTESWTPVPRSDFPNR